MDKEYIKIILTASFAIIGSLIGAFIGTKYKTKFTSWHQKRLEVIEHIYEGIREIEFLLNEYINPYFSPQENHKYNEVIIERENAFRIAFNNLMIYVSKKDIYLEDKINVKIGEILRAIKENFYDSRIVEEARRMGFKPNDKEYQDAVKRNREVRNYIDVKLKEVLNELKLDLRELIEG